MHNLNSLMKKLGEFESSINYTFKNKRNGILALTHSSYSNENKHENVPSNERVEFLGDAILNLVISEKIYKDYPQLNEGEMTKVRATIVCESSLMKCSNNIGVGDFLLLGKGEELTGGRTRTSILSDAFEAIIGSIYIDGGMESGRKFTLEQMGPLIQDSINGALFLDYKTQFQEVVQKKGESKIQYRIIDEKGPDHNKIFVTQVTVDNKVMGVGEGKSKKESEQNAARKALLKV